MDQKHFQEHLDNRFDALDSRLDRVESKLDSHLERLSKAEASIEWLKGHAKIVTTVILTVAGFIAAAYLTYLGE